MNLLKKKDKPKKVKHAKKIKLFFTMAMSFEKAYGPSEASFPKEEMKKAGKTLVKEDVLDAFGKLREWNSGLPEPNKELDEALLSLSQVIT